MSSLALFAAVWAAAMVILLAGWIFVMAPRNRRLMRISVARAAGDPADPAGKGNKEALQQSA